MGHLFIGHGGLDPAGYSYEAGMGIVAIPPGTTLQFYADAGQDLRFGSLEQVLPQLQAPWPALTSANVTYNLTLTAFSEITTLQHWSAAMQNSPHEPHLPGLDLGESVSLCTGAVGQCPTDPRLGLPHACDGLLARYTGELHWIACTGFVLPETEEERIESGMSAQELAGTHATLDAARGDAPPSVFLGDDPDDWEQYALRLTAPVKEMLTAYQSLGNVQGFRDYVNGDNFTEEEREVLRADPDIAAALTGQD
jgi:hypothetical protein